MTTDTDKTSRQNPFVKANWLSKFFFWWINDIIWYDRKHDLVAEDLYGAISEDLSEPLTCTLESAWNEEVDDARKRKKQPSLWKVVIRMYYWDFIKLAFFPTCYTIATLAHPGLLYLIISYFPPISNVSSQWAYLHATIFIFLIIIRTIILYHGNFYLNRLGMQARIACTSLIYRKMIRLPPSASQKMSNSILSLLSVDVAKFDGLFVYMPFIIIVPVQLPIVAWLISQYVGLFAATVGVALLVLQTLPIQGVCSKMTLKFRAKQAARTDFRISLINEIITGIRAVKMHVWEKSLEKLVYSARSLEMASYIKISYLSSAVMSISTNSYRMCAFAVTIIYVSRGSLISADEILPATQHFFNTRTSLSVFFFFGLMGVIDMSVSMKRIEDFLLLKEVKLSAEDDNVNVSKVISVEHVTTLWDDKSVFFKDISLDFAAKNFYAVVGSIGSGKSSLLKLILGELKTASGKVFVRGKVSYASQEPWLFNGSIKDNILFGEMYNEERYEMVVDACALTDDFIQSSFGDQTSVGERGSNLSGGQRARINLARAVYREADIYLLDDPLSAVDATVGKKIMKDCINGLLRDKTRILVTHCIQQLDRVQEIILLDHAEIEFRGNMEEFCRSDQHMARLITNEPAVSRKNSKPLSVDKFVGVKQSSFNSRKESSEETNKLIPSGSIKTSVYLSYVKAGGWFLASLVVLTNFGFVITASLFDWGLGAWTNRENVTLMNETEKNITTLMEDPRKINSSYNEKIIRSFGSLIALTIFISILKYLLLSKFTLNVSKNIHNDMFSRLMGTTLKFFNANSTGKILNRFLEDVGVLDNALSLALTLFVNPTIQVIAVVLSILMANWWTLIPIVISIYITLLIGKLYIRTMQQMKRIAGSARSPILSFAVSSLEGVTTIRACRAERIVAKEFDTRQDRRTSAEALIIALSKAFSMWVELIFVGFLLLMICSFFISKDNDTDGGNVGLILMQILIVTEIVPFEVIKISEVLAHMISVERMLQFKELEQENLIEDEPAVDLPNFWPNKGELIFEHLYLRYSDDGYPVLLDIHCHVESGSKVGIVGRTGAGKSSLVSALFRFAKTDGSIFIDGIDIKKIDLYELRSRISVFPQEPILFRTSLRKNLDPMGKFDDATLFSALESVDLRHIFDSLDLPIERGGNNLSVGQRQLLCLARAIVSKNKILILDEATANVDPLTDAVIQKTIRRAFKGCTVLTIAHRLNTVMDSDKIMVMDSGRLMEYDHPFLLLQNKDSYLFKMVEQGGETAMQHFMAIAKQSYDLSTADETSKQ